MRRVLGAGSDGRLASPLRVQAEAQERALARWRELSRFDAAAAAGLRLAGVDEVGRGPLAGPVSAAAVILPPGYQACGLDDSKRLSASAREAWALRLRADAMAWAIADLPAEEIDRLGIVKAVLTVMARAVRALNPQPERVLVDGRDVIPGEPRSVAVVRGDATSLAVAAASVLAKVHRDALMVNYHELWPRYGFAQHKGYGSAQHRRAILEWGLCPLHRRSFCARWIAEIGAGGGRPLR